MSIFEKLQTVRVALQDEQIKKSGHNTFSNYDYYELKDFLPAINRLCLTYKVSPIIDFSDEKYVTLTIYDFEKPEEKIVFYSPKVDAAVKGAQTIQNIGATETYQRRYLYLMAFEIAESDTVKCTQGDKDDKTKSRPDKQYPVKNESKSNNNVINKAQLDSLIGKAEKNHILESDILAIANFKFNVNQLTELKIQQFADLMNDMPKLWDEFLKQNNKAV